MLTADKGWQWSSWTKRNTQTRPLDYLVTPILTGPFPRTPPTNSKTNSMAYSVTLSKQVDSRTQPIAKCTLPVQSLQVLWSPQNPQSGHSLRPIVSSRGAITYEVTKELAGIICPLVGKSQHHLKNTQHFIQQIWQVKLEEREVISSYDVKALFTSVPSDPSINIVKQRLTQEPTLPQRSQMSIPQIVTLLDFCLKNTCFLFWGKYYEQVHGAAMGSPISPLIANLFMEEFEVKTLRTAPHSPNLW